MRSKLTAFALGLAGVVTALLLYHLWTDHVALHTVINYLNSNAAKINKLP